MRTTNLSLHDRVDGLQVGGVGQHRDVNLPDIQAGRQVRQNIASPALLRGKLGQPLHLPEQNDGWEAQQSSQDVQSASVSLQTGLSYC